MTSHRRLNVIYYGKKSSYGKSDSFVSIRSSFILCLNIVCDGQLTTKVQETKEMQETENRSLGWEDPLE